MKSKFDVTEQVNEFKKSIKCPDPRCCKIEPVQEFHLSFPKNNNTNQNVNISNKHIIHTNPYRNESSNNHKLHDILELNNF